MNLQNLFQDNPDESIVREFPKGSGIKYIPIKEVKRLLHEKFEKWGTSNLKVQYIQRGHDFIISGSVELNLEIAVFNGVERYTFIGANSFKIGTEQAEGDSENYEATLLANCIKNGAKNCGNLFGQNLNTRSQIEIPSDYEPKKDKPKSDNKKVEKGIKDIINQTQTK
jgi:hypothetical protein